MCRPLCERGVRTGENWRCRLGGGVQGEGVEGQTCGSSNIKEVFAALFSRVGEVGGTRNGEIPWTEVRTKRQQDAEEQYTWMREF